MARSKGTPNRSTALLREMICHALDGVGGVEYLKRQAEENPNAFMSLLGRVLPIQAQISDPNGGPVRFVVYDRMEDAQNEGMKTIEHEARH